MTQTFQCPACGAPLDAPASGETTVRCPFCNNSVIVPADARTVGTNVTAQMAGVPAHIQAQISAFLRQGQKIEAIKLYRQITDVGLKEAKDAVEALEKGDELPAGASPLPAGTDGWAAIASLIHSNQKIEAIKLYRQMTGVGLKEAKDAVEAMQRGEPVQISTTSTTYSTRSAGYSPVTEPAGPGRGCVAGWVIVLFLLMVIVGLAILFFANSRAGAPISVVGLALPGNIYL